jgi:hypothetical protein
LHAKNNVHDTLHFIELLRIQVVGDLDVFVVGSGDLEREACARPMGTFQDITSMDRILFAVFTHENKSQGVSILFLLTQNN